MYARVEDLKKGDVVLIGSSTGIYDVQLLRTPQRAKLGKLTTWGGRPRWATVPCMVRVAEITHNYTGSGGYTHKYVVKQKVCSNGEPYTDEKRVDFSEKECWILKREI